MYRQKRKEVFPMEAMIEIDGLRKSFRIARRRPGLLGGLRSVVDPDARIVEAVHDLSLRIERGEMIGLIGPNGAGKSTTIKMLTGILVPTSGQVSVAGLNPVRQRRELARRIGVVFGQRSQLWWDLPLIDSLRLLRFLYRVPEKRHADNLERLRAMLALDEFIDTPVRQLSLGQRMRGDLAAALLHDPELLYLDEPTIGLDVVAKARIREFLQAINVEQKVTVLHVGANRRPRAIAPTDSTYVQTLPHRVKYQRSLRNRIWRPLRSISEEYLLIASTPTNIANYYTGWEN